MKVVLHPSDQAGCGHYRMIWPARAAAAEGAATVKLRIGEAPVRWQARGSQLGVRPTDPDADVVVLQRVCSKRIVEFIPFLQAIGKAVVVDVDDDMTALDPRHPGFRHFHPHASPDTNWRHLQKACSLADLVTVSTPALARRYGAHGRVMVLENRVPAAMLDMPRESDGATVGWGGTIESHPGDLQATSGGVALMVADSGWRFQQIGPRDGVQEALRLQSPHDATGSIPSVVGYQQALGQLDIGIVPLADGRFNEAKSFLKGLEYAARGVPFVASPSPEYLRLEGLGAGVTAAARARSWRGQLVRLTDDQVRAELAAQGRELVREQYTFDGNGWRWADAWAQALANRHARPLGGRVKVTITDPLQRRTSLDLRPAIAAQARA